MSILTKIEPDHGQTSVTSRTSEFSAVEVSSPYQRTLSGCHARPNEDAFDGQEVPTLAGPDSLADRLTRALDALGERDRQIRLLEQRLEDLNGGQSTSPESRSQLRALAPSAANRGTSNAGPEAIKDAGLRESVPPAPTTSTVQWHSITVQTAPPKSQRRTERHAIELPVEFDLETEFYAGITRDISEGGVFIATYCIQPIGTIIGLAFELPCGTRIETRGTVRWIRDTAHTSRPGMGVAFTALSAESLAAIANFCRHNAPLYVEL